MNKYDQSEDLSSRQIKVGLQFCLFLLSFTSAVRDIAVI